jgi:hypothetical protein
MKNIDLNHINNRISDLKNQVDGIRFRKPWTNSRSNSPFMVLALGIGAAAIGYTLYKNRTQFAKLCGKCGIKIKESMNDFNHEETSKEL